ncbi:hypothetical protein QZH41_008678 [Actinostola sp. cb2023]|nr:hypothetical protein QZH41_008678 [Actinostola sp. cb2023]
MGCLTEELIEAEFKWMKAAQTDLKSEGNFQQLRYHAGFRVKEAPPFAKTGVDFAGLLYVKLFMITIYNDHN